MEGYREIRRSARVVGDRGGYEIGRGEMNPVIFEDFLGEVLDRDLLPVIWEPFAGHNGPHGPSELCDEVGVELVACDLQPVDDRVRCCDSSPGSPILRS